MSSNIQSRKFHVIGGPGSGKTTLARLIASRLSIPHYDLDILEIVWEDESLRAKAYAERVLSLVEQPCWVSEGIYLIFTEPFLYHADTIVLLQVHWLVAVWRIIQRYVITSLRGTNRYRGLKTLYYFLKDTIQYYWNRDRDQGPTLEETLAYLAQYEEQTRPPTIEFLIHYTDNHVPVICPPSADFTFHYLQRYKEKLVVIRNRSEYRRFVQSVGYSLTSREREEATFVKNTL